MKSCGRCYTAPDRMYTFIIHTCSRLPLQPQLVHLHSQLEQIVQTLRLRLRLRHILAPNVDTMPLDQHRARLGPLPNRRLQTVLQVLLVRCVFDNRNLHRVEVAQVAELSSALGDFHAPRSAAGDSLDLLDLVHREHVLVGTLLAGFAEQSNEHRPLRVCVDAAPGVARGEGCQEEGSAC
jgi:hypothetical protein